MLYITYIHIYIYISENLSSIHRFKAIQPSGSRRGMLVRCCQTAHLIRFFQSNRQNLADCCSVWTSLCRTYLPPKRHGHSWRLQSCGPFGKRGRNRTSSERRTRRQTCGMDGVLPISDPASACLSRRRRCVQSPGGHRPAEGLYAHIHIYIYITWKRVVN